MRDTPPDMKVRLSAELREKIAAAAKENNRTLNSEIVFRLEASFADDAGVPDFVTGSRLDFLGSELEALRAEVRALAWDAKIAAQSKL